jgi:hypothetical protein
MRDSPTVPAQAYAPDADRAGPDASAQLPEWLVHLLAVLIRFLLEHALAARLRRSRRLTSMWPDPRPDLPAGSAQAQAASIRGHFGNVIAWMCRRNGIGPGHKAWPELARAIVAFGGSVKGLRAGPPARGLLWWESPNVVPGMVLGFGVPAPTTTLLQRVAVASAAPPAPNAVRAEVAHAEAAHAEARHAEAAHVRLAAPWRLASVRQVFARAGPGPSTGPPRCPGLPTLSCLNARGRSTAGPAVLIRAD